MKKSESIPEFLKRFEKWLYGVNFECHFVFEKICESSEIQRARELINTQFQLSWQTEVQLVLITYEEFLKDISEKLLYRGDKWAGVHRNENKESEFRIEVEKLKHKIQEKFNPLTTEIYIHPDINDWIFWSFCFLIASKDRNEVYLFEGISSD
jgi:hypothetical protein